MQEFEREIWFKCDFCGRESYCEAEFNDYDDPEVLCPFCRKTLKLNQCRVQIK